MIIREGMNMIDSRQASVVFARIRERRPLVHHITNFVVMNTTANITLCAGALPVMAHAIEEVEEMVGAAGALVLNIGTLDSTQVAAMLAAGRRANQLGIPIVLDPVGAGATRLRTDSSRRLLDELSIAIVRGNLAEVATLAGVKAEISGVESIGVAEDAAAVATSFARSRKLVVAVTGAVDVVTDGTRLVRVANGDPLMGAVTGTGCMATAVVAACAAVEPDRVMAAASALAAYGVAGEIAAARAQGPGTFAVQLFDALAALTPDVMQARMHLQESAC
jgi:hydroxyethylthiazole kinase